MVSLLVNRKQEYKESAPERIAYWGTIPLCETVILINLIEVKSYIFILLFTY